MTSGKSTTICRASSIPFVSGSRMSTRTTSGFDLGDRPEARRQRPRLRRPRRIRWRRRGCGVCRPAGARGRPPPPPAGSWRLRLKCWDPMPPTDGSRAEGFDAAHASIVGSSPPATRDAAMPMAMAETNGAARTGWMLRVGRVVRRRAPTGFGPASRPPPCRRNRPRSKRPLRWQSVRGPSPPTQQPAINRAERRGPGDRGTPGQPCASTAKTAARNDSSDQRPDDDVPVVLPATPSHDDHQRQCRFRWPRLESGARCPSYSIRLTAIMLRQGSSRRRTATCRATPT